jgi:predicted metal-dependent hydrolase
VCIPDLLASLSPGSRDVDSHQRKEVRVMNDATLRRRIVVLVIATLLSVMAASATAAVSADGAAALAVQGAQAGFGQANQGTFGG